MRLDHIIQPPADYIHPGAVIALGDSFDDAVIGLDLLAQISRAAGHQFNHGDLFILHAQHAADAFQRQAHLDIEILGVARREIGGVRIEGLGDGIHVELKDVLAAGLARLIQAVLVAFAQQFRAAAGSLPETIQGQHFVLEPLAPELVEFGGAPGPGRVLAIDVQGFIAVKAEILAEQRLDAFAAVSPSRCR